MMTLYIHERGYEEHDDHIFCHEMIYDKIKEGLHDFVLNFLKKVPNTEKKGNKMHTYYSLLF